MIKVMIVVSGLVMLVPDGPPTADPRGLTALFTSSTKFRGEMGHEMPAHTPAIFQRGTDKAQQDWKAEPGFSYLIRLAAQPQASIDLGAEADSIDLASLTAAPDRAIVRSECLRGDCKDSQGRNLVAGRVRLEGGWRSRPQSRCETDWVAKGLVDHALFDFRTLSHLETPRAGAQPRKVATAISFEAQVDRLEDLVITFGDQPVPVQKLSPPAVCRDWIGKDVNDCVVLEIENWPEARQRPECPPNDIAHWALDCRADHHFQVFYELLAEAPKPEDRLVPFIVNDDLRCTAAVGGGNKPDPRCPHVFGRSK